DNTNALALLVAQRGVAPENLRVTEDSVQRCPQLMTYASEKVTFGATRRVGGFLGRLQGARRFAFRGDIGCNTLEVIDRALGVADHTHRFGNPDGRAIGAEDLGFESCDFIALQD